MRLHAGEYLLEKRAKKNPTFSEGLCLAPFLDSGTASIRGNTCWTPKCFTSVCTALAQSRAKAPSFTLRKGGRERLNPMHSFTVEGEKLWSSLPLYQQ